MGRLEIRMRVMDPKGWRSRLRFRLMSEIRKTNRRILGCLIVLRILNPALFFHINVKSDVPKEYARILLPHPTKVE